MYYTGKPQIITRENVVECHHLRYIYSFWRSFYFLRYLEKRGCLIIFAGTVDSISDFVWNKILKLIHCLSVDLYVCHTQFIWKWLILLSWNSVRVWTLWNTDKVSELYPHAGFTSPELYHLWCKLAILLLTELW